MPQWLGYHALRLIIRDTDQLHHKLRPALDAGTLVFIFQQGFGDSSHRGAFKNPSERDFNLEGLTQMTGELDSQQGVTAALKEMIENSYLLSLQQLRKDGSYDFFHRGAGRNIFLFRTGIFVCRNGQSFSIELAAGSKRKRVEHHEPGRKHVLRQTFFQVIANLPQSGWLARLERCIGCQALIANSIPMDYDCRVLYCRMLQQSALNLLQFHAVATNFDLVVNAAQELDFTIA